MTKRLSRRCKPRRRGPLSQCRPSVERLEERALLAGLPYGAFPQETAEFLLGRVAVTVVYMESNGGSDTSQHDWNPQHMSEVRTSIEDGLQWWVDTLEGLNTKHSLEFVVDWQYADVPVQTVYEPINRPSTDYDMWVGEFLGNVGFDDPSENLQTDIRSFNNAQRMALDTDWAFTIFVANSENDADGKWAPGGFERAFAFSGGRFIATPSTRPASTIAHELGHQFWGLDEYVSGGTYTDFRGYYNTQNLNAWDAPGPQQDSIMADGDFVANAYDSNTSPASTLAMVGWQDSDGDGVFDVLDVPHSLDGVGYLNEAGDRYLFQGQAKVQTLENLNSKLFGDTARPSHRLFVNDITTNRIDRVQYRIDGGNWITAGVFDEAEVELDLSIPLPANADEIEIRTVTLDQGVVAASPIFTGEIGRVSSTLETGVNGFVFLDADEDGELDPDERGAAGWTLQLVDEFGNPLALQNVVEPDDFSNGSLVGGAGVTLTAQGEEISDTDVIARVAGEASTGNQAFAYKLGGNFTGRTWGEGRYELRVDMNSAVRRVSLDAFGELDPAYGRLEAFDAAGNLIDRYTTSLLDPGDSETMTVASTHANIDHVVAFGHANTFVGLDNLRVGAPTTAETDANGVYRFTHLDPGVYRVALADRPGFEISWPTPAVQEVVVTQGSVAANVDFGAFGIFPWHNASLPEDVTGDTRVTFVDAVAQVQDVRARGLGPLAAPTPDDSAPPYVDVFGDNSFEPFDIVLVVAKLNEQLRLGGSGEGSSLSQLLAADQPTSYTDIPGFHDSFVAMAAQSDSPSLQAYAAAQRALPSVVSAPPSAGLSAPRPALAGAEDPWRNWLAEAEPVDVPGRWRPTASVRKRLPWSRGGEPVADPRVGPRLGLR